MARCTAPPCWCRGLGPAAAIPIHAETEVLPLDQANVALRRVRDGTVHGAAVLVP